MTEIMCHSMDEYFSEITKAVIENGRGMNTSLEYDTMRMVVTFPDRDIKIGMNLVKSLGDTGKWDEQLFLLTSGTIVSRVSRIDNKKIPAIYAKRLQKAIEDGVTQGKSQVYNSQRNP